jgi:hypothetical protein
MALNTKGLTNKDAINGFGLLTFGLVWGCGDIWTRTCLDPSTSWSATSGATVTTWTEVIENGVEDCE